VFRRWVWRLLQREGSGVDWIHGVLSTLNWRFRLVDDDCFDFTGLLGHKHT
jgi:hypothetical protein